MPETMLMTREQILEAVREVLEEALGADPEDITPDATLMDDLGAESIDVLDIQFRLEKRFSTPSKPFKIEKGELFPENLMENPAWVSNGKFTDAGMAMLKQRMPHVDVAQFDKDRDVNNVREIFTVKSLVDFVERKLKA